MFNLFKKEYELLELPFTINFDDEALFLEMEAKGLYQNENYTFGIIFYCKTVELYDEMRETFKDLTNKKVKLNVNVKKVKDFKVDQESLSTTFNNPNITKLEILGFGCSKDK